MVLLTGATCPGLGVSHLIIGHDHRTHRGNSDVQVHLATRDGRRVSSRAHARVLRSKPGLRSMANNYWFVIEQTGASVCLQNPKFGVDVIVTADIAAFYRVWLAV
jgi:hypothetical protein